VQRVGLKEQTLTILLLEDDPHDVFFIQRAMEQASVAHTLQAVANGEEGIAYLRGDGPYSDRMKYPVPNIILTDIKMPRMDGFEFLHWLRHHPEWSVIPTIVLSSSSIDSDVRRAYEAGANAYLRKPSSQAELAEIIRITSKYWCMCERPPIITNW